MPENDPPFGIPDPSLWTVLAAWQPGPFPWQRLKGIPQGVIAPTDDPPFGSRDSLWQILQAWQPGPFPWQRGKGVPQGVITPTDDPPFGGRESLWQILGTWQVVFFPEQRGPAVPQGIDDPPFGSREAFWQILGMWQPAAPVFQRELGVLSPGIDNPPFGIPEPSLWTILGAWQPSQGPIIWRPSIVSSELVGPSAIELSRKLRMTIRQILGIDVKQEN